MHVHPWKGEKLKETLKGMNVAIKGSIKTWSMQQQGGIGEARSLRSLVVAEERLSANGKEDELDIVKRAMG